MKRARILQFEFEMPQAFNLALQVGADGEAEQARRNAVRRALEEAERAQVRFEDLPTAREERRLV